MITEVIEPSMPPHPKRVCNITLLVEALSGHYRVPGQVRQSVLAASYPTCPPSTMRGFLESLCGESFGSFQGRFAYGHLRSPGGHGVLTRKVSVWASGSRDNEGHRTIGVETFIDLAYCVQVEGPWVPKIQEALAGKVDRYGVLYLGESTDMVTWVGEMQDPIDHVEWLVPGTNMTLPTRSGRGYDNLKLTTGTFDLRVGQPEWIPV